MKTTIDIADPSLTRPGSWLLAKVTVKALVELGLRQVIAERKKARWIRLGGSPSRGTACSRTSRALRGSGCVN
jgi:hypothetical protein